MLYSYANGQHYSELSHHQSFLLGRESAQIHLNAIHINTKDLPIKKTKELLVNPLATLSIGYSERYHELRYIRGLANVAADKLSHLSPYQSVCHGDYHWGNVFFDNERITVFDFDFC
ncbi:phosphotransferase [Vibrio sp. 99-70-13A1]|uniref:phosphotransferase n=1 Tax=Vibrio sp. 99-70-13A1 TaxID=2607601 RepID=UPI001493B922